MILKEVKRRRISGNIFRVAWGILARRLGAFEKEGIFTATLELNFLAIGHCTTIILPAVAYSTKVK
jgi:hypothetical protein